MLECKSQLKDWTLAEGPVYLTLLFLFARPKTHFGTGRNAGKLKESAPVYHTKRPDLDNLVKFAEDCLTGIAWKDDCQVASTLSQKRYAGLRSKAPDREPQTVITIALME